MDQKKYADVMNFRNEIRDLGLLKEIHVLSRSSVIRTVVSFCINWIAIGLCVLLVAKVSLLFIFLAIPVIGSRQRAMSNLIHDASHANLVESRIWNDRLTNLLAAFPMLESVQNYRSSHLKHHQYLGVDGQDPDLESHKRYGFDDYNPPTNKPFRTYIKLVFNLNSWKDSGIGAFFGLSRHEQGIIILWWVFGVASFAVLDMAIAVQFLALWWLSRLTSYHAIRLFAEFLDHSGLRPGSVLNFTRNVPRGSWLARGLMHPHADNYHLVHHLLPQIPHYNLADAHRALSKCKTYRQGHHCDGYFLGNDSAVNSWMGYRKGS